MLLEYLFFDKSKRNLVEQLNDNLQEHWGKLKKDGRVKIFSHFSLQALA